MLALSTSWLSERTAPVAEMMATIKHLGIKEIELSYRMSEAMFRQLKKPLKHSGLKVVSIHNYFPVPSVRADRKGSGDLFLLSSPDNTERQDAIHYTTKTIEYAAELGAVAVVLHCGLVEMNHEMNHEMHTLYQFYNAKRLDLEEVQIWIHNKLKERNSRKPKHMENLLTSLERLVRVAE